MRFALLIILLPLRLFAATYYVDFDAGSDSNAGTSTGAAFKHCPGDALATSTAAGTTLAAGDTVNFKGGVVYRGQVVGQASGSAGNFITLQGDASVHGWGTGKAIMEGAVVSSFSWTPCANAADCYTNVNWANIYYSAIPAALTNTAFQSILVNGTNILPLAQEPNPTDRIQIDVVGEWYSPTAMTSSLTTDSARFTNGNPAFYNECLLGRYLTVNAADFVSVTGYSPSANIITNAASGSIGTPPAYTIFNHPFHIDQAGEYAIRTNENRIYYWPRNSENPSTVTYSVAVNNSAFLDVGHSYLQYNGFKIRGYFGAVGATGERGTAFDTDSVATTRSNMVVGNCEIALMRSMDRDWIIEVRRGFATVTNNTLTDSYGGGFIVGTSLAIVQYNTLSNITGTAGYVNTCTNCDISYNNFLDVRGTHAQGVSIYGNDLNNWCVDVYFHHNKVLNYGALLTHQWSTNIFVYNNIFDAQESGGQINHWSGVKGTWYINNVMVGNTNDNILSVGGDNTAWHHRIINNIIDGGGVEKSVTFANSISDYNIFISFASPWSQGTNDMGPGDIYNTNLTAIFIDPTARDWRLKPGSVAADMGTNVFSYFWDGRGVTNDFIGTIRPQNVLFDIGAYEGASSATSSSRAPTLFQGNIRAQGGVIFR